MSRVWAKDFYADKNQEPADDHSSMLEREDQSKIRQSSSSFPELASPLQEKIITLLSSRNEGFTVSFAGMKRLLGDVHQQKLTKSIQRLLEANILQKNDEGYQLSPEFYQMSTSKLSALKSRTRLAERMLARKINWNRHDSMLKGSFYLSKETDPRTIHDHFKGRWFGRFRYVGGTISEKRASAEWISDDLHSYLRLTVRPREIDYHIMNPRSGDEAALRTFLFKTVSKPLDVDLSLTPEFN